MKQTAALIRALKSRSIGVLTKQFFLEHTQFVLDLNRANLYDKGEDGEGEAIEPPYSPFTVAIKQRKRQPYDRVTLKDKGDFHMSFLLAASTTQIAIKATDVKTASLQGKYGRDVLGLQPKDIDAIKPLLLAYLQKNILKK